MTERADADDHLHGMLLTELQEPAQVALTIPTETALLLLMDIPEHVGGYHTDATSLHLQDFLLPLVCGIT